jgi:hypothetical protein
MAVDAGDEQCRAAGYHESAHIVIACELSLPISPKGTWRGVTGRISNSKACYGMESTLGLHMECGRAARSFSISWSATFLG